MVSGKKNRNRVSAGQSGMRACPPTCPSAPLLPRGTVDSTILSTSRSGPDALFQRATTALLSASVASERNIGRVLWRLCQESCRVCENRIHTNRAVSRSAPPSFHPGALTSMFLALVYRSHRERAPRPSNSYMSYTPRFAASASLTAQGRESSQGQWQR